MTGGRSGGTLPTVSIVITTYARRDRLRRVVDAALADPYAGEVVAVVDGCADGSYELLTGLAARQPKLLPVWQDNGGAAAARATGVRRASGEVVLLLDDDVLAGPGLAEGHASAHAGRADLVAVGYLPTTPPAVRGPGDVATILYAEDYQRACARYEREPATVLPYLWAGNISIRRTDALRVGLAGARRLDRHNDQDFGLRCARAGLTGVFDRALAARHLHERDLASFRRQAWQAGAARRSLGEAHPDLLPDADPGANLSGAQRLAVGLAAAPLVRGPSRPLLWALLVWSGRARLWALQTAAARLLRQVELVCGYRGHG